MTEPARKQDIEELAPEELAQRIAEIASDQVAQDIRGFVEGKNFPKESVYRSGVR